MSGCRLPISLAQVLLAQPCLAPIGDFLFANKQVPFGTCLLAITQSSANNHTLRFAMCLQRTFSCRA